jgi:hypothetical protein
MLQRLPGTQSAFVRQNPPYWQINWGVDEGVPFEYREEGCNVVGNPLFVFSLDEIGLGEGMILSVVGREVGTIEGNKAGDVDEAGLVVVAAVAGDTDGDAVGNDFVNVGAVDEASFVVNGAAEGDADDRVLGAVVGFVDTLVGDVVG